MDSGHSRKVEVSHSYLISTLLRDDFQGGGLAQWQVHDGTWTIGSEAGNKVFLGESGDNYARASAGDATWADQVVEAHLTPTSLGASDSAIILAARFVDVQNHYSLVLTSSSIAIVRTNGGVSTTLASATFTIAVGTTYRLKLQAIGTALKVYVGTQQLLSFIDDSPSAIGQGKMAVGGYKGKVTVDNVVVSSGVVGDRCATSPDPAHQGTKVDPLKILRWTAGLGAVRHQVYLGTISPPQAVGDPQTESYYQPPTPLAEDTTYYWGVDEIDADNNVSQCQVWQFKTRPRLPEKSVPSAPENGAQGVSVKATLKWTTGAGSKYDYVCVARSEADLDKHCEVRGGNDWEYPSLLGNTTYFWRVDASNDGGTTKGDIWTFTTGESVAPGKARTPSPTDQATNVPVGTSLTWAAGYPIPDEHLVYLWKDGQNPPAVPDVQAETT